MESILDNLIFAGVLGGGLVVWAIVSRLPGPVIALLFLLAVGAVLWILGQIRSRVSVPRVLGQDNERVLGPVAGLSDSRYLPDSYIRGRIINLLDMIAPGGIPIISNRTIEDCEIRGPAFMAPVEHVTMADCGFDGDIESIFIEVAEKRQVIGAVGVKDCVFRRCRFTQIGIVGTREIVAKAKAGFARLARLSE